jgi:hypothetical protein
MLGGTFERLAAVLSRKQSALPEHVQLVLDAAFISLREGPDGEGDRAVIGLDGPRRGMFELDDQTADRIRSRWPELNAGQVKRAVSYLAARVRLAAMPTRRERRRSWVFDF